MIPPLFALFTWPLISVALFRKLALPVAVAVTIIGGYLLLPTRYFFNLPLLPTLDKHSIPAVSALVLALVFAMRNQGLKGLLPRSALPVALIVVLVLSSLMTVLTNGDRIRIGGTVLPGLRLFDGFSSMLGLIVSILPFLVARKFLGDQSGQRILLAVLSLGALAYSPLILIELRLSPQLNNWVYGFFPHSWVQHIRANGYRPLVFLEHGLRLSIFLAMATLAAAALFRSATSRPTRLLVLSGWLLLMVLASKSLGALLITLALAPLILFLSARLQLIIAAVLGLVVLLYPMARASGNVPVQQFQELVAEYSPQRAASFNTRLENEEALLSKATERPIFGWGGWGRSRIYDERGTDITIADGYWIIVFGVGGWVRYISLFGLLILPIVLLSAKVRGSPANRETAALALILIANLIDMVPNSSMSPITWFVAGSLWGKLEHVSLSRRLRTGVHDATRPNDDVPAAMAPASKRRAAGNGNERTTNFTRQSTRRTRPRR